MTQKHKQKLKLAEIEEASCQLSFSCLFCFKLQLVGRCCRGAPCACSVQGCSPKIASDVKTSLSNRT